MSIAIKAENISKAYQLGQIGTGTISRDIERWVAKIRGKEDPFLKIGETNDRTQKGTSDIVWSLKDINFEINQGDAVGIIGRNGAGKSTLLKILSRVTAPTTGSIKVKGRIASLLEVGTGFHPELTGRENIYLNGAILGMRKKEITRKFDEIVDFSGVERYIDTPVKRYSSGMYVRLAFAVAAHLDSEILVVDEVLAVGDAEFQNKCLGKMGEVSQGQGRTILFVSHNMSAVRVLCNKGLVLTYGTSSPIMNVHDAVNRYYSDNNDKKNLDKTKLIISNHALVTDFGISTSEEVDETNSKFFTYSQVSFSFLIQNYFQFSRKVLFNLEFSNEEGYPLFCAGNEFNGIDFLISEKNSINVELNFKSLRLKPGKYRVKFFYYDASLNYYFHDVINEWFFEVIAADVFNTGKLPLEPQHGNIIASYKPMAINTENYSLEVEI